MDGIIAFLFGKKKTEFERGEENARIFLAENPSEMEFAAMLAGVHSSEDDYEAGYLSILRTDPSYYKALHCMYWGFHV